MKKILSIALIAALALTSVFAATYNGKAALELGYDLDSSKYGFENSTSRKLKWTITYDTGTAGSEGEGDLRAVIAAEFTASQKVADDSDYVAESTQLPKEDKIKFTAAITKADILYKDLVRVGILNSGKSADYAKAFYKEYVKADGKKDFSNNVTAIDKYVPGFNFTVAGFNGGLGLTGNAEGLTVAAGAAALLNETSNTFNANAKIAYSKDLLAASVAVDFQVTGENILLESAVAASYDFVKFNAYYYTKDKFENNNLDAKLSASKTIDIVTLTGSFEGNNIFDQANAFYAKREFTPALEASVTVDAFTFGAKASYAIIAKKLSTEANVKYANDFLTAKAALNVNTTFETEDSTQLYVSASVESKALIDGATVSLAYAPHKDATTKAVDENLLKADTTKLGKITASCKIEF